MGLSPLVQHLPTAALHAGSSGRNAQYAAAHEEAFTKNAACPGLMEATNSAASICASPSMPPGMPENTPELTASQKSMLPHGPEGHK